MKFEATGVLCILLRTASQTWKGLGHEGEDGHRSSVEKEKNVTIVACVSATGVYVPPMMMFLRVRMKPELLDGSPPDSIGHANKSGWITAELFKCWFDHFVEAVQLNHQQMPAQNHTPNMIRQGIQHYTVGKDHTTASRKRNKEEKMKVDRTHTEETWKMEKIATNRQEWRTMVDGLCPSEQTGKSK